jgi:hypothetical protein
MKNDTRPRTMHQWGERNGKLGPVVNPQDISRPKPLNQGMKDASYHVAMQAQWQTLELPAETLVHSHGRELTNISLLHTPTLVRRGTNNNG